MLFCLPALLRHAPQAAAITPKSTTKRSRKCYLPCTVVVLSFSRDHFPRNRGGCSPRNLPCPMESRPVPSQRTVLGFACGPSSTGLERPRLERSFPCEGRVEYHARRNLEAHAGRSRCAGDVP